MPSGYGYQGVDLDDLFDLSQPGDLEAPLTGAMVDGEDVKERYVDASVGSPLGYPVGYAFQGKDFSQIFAAKRSVPRYPSPLPWAITAPVNATVYRQPSRPTLTNTISYSLSVHREGMVAITRTYPVYNSAPGQVVQDHLYTTANPALWNDAGAAPNSPYQVLVEHVSGVAPTLAHGQQLGQWFTLNTNPYNSTTFLNYVYTHSTVEGSKTASSQIRVSVRRAEFPDSNKAGAINTVNFTLTVEPSVYPGLPSLGSINPVYSGLTANPESPQVYRSAARLRLLNDRTYVFEQAMWAGGATNPSSWTTVSTGQWLRPGFNVSDYEVNFGVVSGGFNDEDVNPGSSWLSLGTSREVRKQIASPSGSWGTYNDSTTISVIIREISTKGWSGYPDNQDTRNYTLFPQISISPPTLIINPASSYDNWAGTFNANTNVEIGPPPNDINDLTIIPASQTFSTSVARTHPTPAECVYSARFMVRLLSDGTMNLLRQTTSGLSTDQVFTTVSTVDYQIIKLTGNPSDYQFRWVFVSGDSLAFGGYENWSNFGTNPTSFNNWLNFGIAASSVNNTASAINRTYTVRLEVRSKAHPTEVFASRQMTFNTSISMTGYVSG